MEVQKRTGAATPSKVELLACLQGALDHAGGMTHLSKNRRAGALRAEQKRLRLIHGLAFSLLDDNNCGGAPRVWKAAEAKHAASTKSAAAEEAAAGVLVFCVDCPVRAGCFEWARADSYTGLAGGLAWAGGVPHLPASTRYQPQPLTG